MQPASPGTGPDAVLFIPGVGEKDSADEAALGFCNKLASALDQDAKTARAFFRVTSRVEQARKELGNRRLFVCGISRVEPNGDEQPVLDIYKLDYRDLLVADYERRSSFGRALITGLEALKGAGRIARAALFSKGVDGKRLLQVLIALLLWLLLVAYFALLLASLTLLVFEGLKQLADGNTEVGGALGRVVEALPHQEALSTVVLASTLITTVIPSRWRQELTGMGANYVRLCTYLSISHQRAALLGRFYALLEHVAEKEPGYARVHVMSYSFGSILALDALFPPATQKSLALPRLSTVDKLVTVGCPFDFVRALWPRYFTDRSAASAAPKSWLNVYTPVDALGSNFRDDNQEQDATVPLADRVPANLVYESRHLGWLDSLSFIALRSHGIYFKPDADPEDQGCLRETVAVAFAGEPILA
jgi:hypothetical protein